MRKQVIAGSLLALTVVLAGCGGGDSATPSGSSPTPSTPTNTSPTPGAAKVAGPLDAVQEPVSAQIIAPLASAFVGTPLQGIALCVDQIVVNDVVDVLDVLATAIDSGAQSGDPEAALAGAAAGVQVQVENIVIDTQGMLSALDGSGNGCAGNVAPTSISGNPLAGTPLEAFGATLAPVLDQVYTALHGASGPRPTLSLTTIASLVTQLEFAVNTAISQLPADVANAPVIGAALTTIQQSVANLADTVTAASTSDTPATQAAIANALNDALSGVLLGVVPITVIETQAGQVGLLSGPIQAGIDDVSAEIGGNNIYSSLLEQNLDAAITPVTDVIESTVLAAILGPLFEVLGEAGVSSSSPLAPVTGILGDFFGGVNGSPLDLVLEQVSGASGCSAAGTLLEGVLCPVL